MAPAGLYRNSGDCQIQRFGSGFGNPLRASGIYRVWLPGLFCSRWIAKSSGVAYSVPISFRNNSRTRPMFVPKPSSVSPSMIKVGVMKRPTRLSSSSIYWESVVTSFSVKGMSCSAKNLFAA